MHSKGRLFKARLSTRGKRGALTGLSVATIAAAIALFAPTEVAGTSEEFAPSPRSRGALLPGRSSCVQCHQFDHNFSHPVDFYPDRQLPEQFPLRQGRFGCTTCHEINPASHPRRNRDESLRAPLSGTAFCSQCHSGGSTTRQGMHAFAFARAHTKVRGRSLDSAPADFRSASCLTCHDGSLATGVSHSGRIRMARMGATSHPFDITYRSTNPSNPRTRLHDRARIDERIRFVNDRLDCGSCHSLYSSLDKLLVMSNERSALCMQCHDY